MRKLFTFSFISILAIILMTACTQDPDNKETTETEENEGTTTETSANDELIVAVQADATMLDPHTGTDIPAANVYHGKIYEGLVKQDENMEIQPALASEWEMIDDLTWEFKLRENVTFHDGTPFNAEAVKKNFERIASEEIASPRATLYEMIEEIEIIDDHTVRFITEYPFAPLLANLAHYAGGIVSPTAAEEHGEGLGLNPVGTGKFQFEEWTPGSEIKLSVYEDYWGDKPSYGTVVFKIVPEDSTRVAMVETGEAHLAEPVPVTEIDRIENSDTMKLNRSEGLGTDYIGFNLNKEPFNDPKVRQAINYAVDTEQIIEGVYNNVGIKAEGPMGPGVWGYSENVKGYEYNIEKAKELLKEAGYEDGFKTTIWTNDDKARMDTAEVVQSQLKGIGIDVEIHLEEWGSFLEATANGEHDMFILGWSNMTGDADYNQYFLFHTDAQGNTGNRSFYSNEKVDELIDLGRQETDPDKRLEIYEEAQEIQVEEAASIFLRYTEYLVAVNNDVEGFWLHPSRILMLDDVTIN